MSDLRMIITSDAGTTHRLRKHVRTGKESLPVEPSENL